MSRTRLDEVLARKKILHEKRLALSKQAQLQAAENAAANLKAQAQQQAARKVVTNQPTQPMSPAVVQPVYEESEEKKARKPTRRAAQSTPELIVEAIKPIEAPKPVEAPKPIETKKTVAKVVQYEDEKEDLSDYSEHSESEPSDFEQSEQYSDDEERKYDQEEEEEDLRSVKEEPITYEEPKKKTVRSRKQPLAANQEANQLPQRPLSAVQASSGPQTDSDSNPISKRNLLNLIKGSGVESITKDVIDACFEVLEQVIETAIGKRSNFSINDATNMITNQFKNGEEDLPEEVTINTASFQKFASSIFTKHKCSVRREAFFMLHLYCEAYLIKMMKAASVVAKNNSRSRVQGGDLAVAYYIHSM